MPHPFLGVPTPPSTDIMLPHAATTSLSASTTLPLHWVSLNPSQPDIKLRSPVHALPTPSESTASRAIPPCPPVEPPGCRFRGQNLVWRAVEAFRRRVEDVSGRDFSYLDVGLGISARSRGFPRRPFQFPCSQAKLLARSAERQFHPGRYQVPH